MNIFEKMKEALDHGAYSYVLDSYEQLVTEQKQHSAIWMIRIKSLVMLERIDEAITDLNNYLEFFSDDIQARRQLCELLERIEDHSAKEIELKINYNLKPKDPSVVADFAAFLLDQERIDEARDILKTISYDDVTPVIAQNIRLLKELSKRGELKSTCAHIHIVFPWDIRKRYTYAALVGAIETDPEVSHRVTVHFAREIKKTLEDVREAKGIKLAAFSIFSTELPIVYSELLDLRRCFPEFIFVAGGPHPTGAPGDTLALGFDYAFIGEAEDSFLSFLRALLSGNNPEYTSGIAYAHDGRMYQNPARTLVNLDYYLPFSEKYPELYSPLELTRGCFFKCKYCQWGYSMGHVRHRSLETVLTYVSKTAQRGYSVARFLSSDALSFGKNKFNEDNSLLLENLLSGIKNTNGISKLLFGDNLSEVRPDSLNQNNINFMKKYVDNHIIKIGLQSGSDEMLTKIGRGHKVDHVMKAIDLLVSNGFLPMVDMIVGLPGETIGSFQQSLTTLKRLASMDVLVRAHTFMPLPGTPFSSDTPGMLSENSRLLLEPLVKEGKLVGYWRAQEIYAKRLWEYMHRVGEFDRVPAPLYEDAPNV